MTFDYAGFERDLAQGICEVLDKYGIDEDCLLTFILRHPSIKEKGCVLTQDQYEAVIDVLREAAEKEKSVRAMDALANQAGAETCH